MKFNLENYGIFNIIFREFPRLPGNRFWGQLHLNSDDRLCWRSRCKASTPQANFSQSFREKFDNRISSAKIFTFFLPFIDDSSFSSGMRRVPAVSLGTGNVLAHSCFSVLLKHDLSCQQFPFIVSHVDDLVPAELATPWKQQKNSHFTLHCYKNCKPLVLALMVFDYFIYPLCR